MFRGRDDQGLFLQDPTLFLSEEKAARLEDTWAHPFRLHCLSLIDESRFAEMYHPDNGRPNKPVETVLGVLFLKEMFNLTDNQAIEQLEFNLLWHHALAVTADEAHLAQKTLHNFRAALMKHDLARVAFQDTTDRIIAALGISTAKQRLDSTHIISNIALLTRLGLFCETIRVFIREVAKDHPRLYKRIPASLLARYVKQSDGAKSGPHPYEDAPTRDARRRLGVCARDLYRLVDMFRGTAAAQLDEYGLIERLLEEQCEIVDEDQPPNEDDDDAGDGGVPVKLKEPKKIESDSLQSPHDPDATYSGHKGKGYETQVGETCHEDNEVQVITHVEVTASSESDAQHTLPAIEDLKARGIQPDELTADTTYGSAENSLDAERLGTELVSPVSGVVPAPAEQDQGTAEEEAPLTAADFQVDPTGADPTVCPAGHQAETEFEDDDKNKPVVFFDEEVCEACPLLSRCPVKRHTTGAGFYLPIDLKARNRERRRRAEASGEFAARYKIRAGIEATNSELKRRHGLGNIRVRGRPRVALAVYLKAAACNIKRMLAHLLGKVRTQTAPVAC